jgi:hypothetical protein
MKNILIKLLLQQFTLAPLRSVTRTPLTGYVALFFFLCLATFRVAAVSYLWNLDFGAGTGPSQETGAAVTGSSGDFWNYYTRDDGNGNWLSFGEIDFLKTADSAVTPVAVAVDNAPGAWGNGSSDHMYDGYIYPFGGAATITIKNLPTGSYNLWVYSPDSSLTVNVGNTGYGSQNTHDTDFSGQPSWTLNRQYAPFSSIVINSATDNLTLTVNNGQSGYATISGLQLVRTSGADIKFTSFPVSQTVSEGSSAAFSVTATGSGTLTYQWFFNGAPIAGKTQSTLTLSSVSVADAGSYAVRVQNGTGQELSGNARLIVWRQTTEKLWNIDLGAGSGPSAKTGAAAIGRTTSDFWNFYTRDDGVGGWLTHGTLNNHKTADGQTPVANVNLIVDNAPGAWGNGSSDSMYESYLYPFDSPPAVITVQNLPVGVYDLYVYSQDGAYDVSCGGVSYGTKTCYDAPIVSPPLWQENRQYVRFPAVRVTSAGQSLTINVQPGQSGYAIISGLQIAQSNPMWNLDFGAGTGPSPKTGAAVVGTSGDFWNYYTRDGANGWIYSGRLDRLATSDGSITPVAVTVVNAQGAWYLPNSTDPMYSKYIYPLVPPGGNATITIKNLPAGTFDLYVYSPDGQFLVNIGATSYGPEFGADPSPVGAPVWQRGVQYGFFQNISLASGQDVVLTVSPNPGGSGIYATISGLQLVQKSGTDIRFSSLVNDAPLVAIHDSEYTRALTASGDWPYFVMPASIKEALRSDGTAFKVVSDANISAGVLLTNGAPRYPILISFNSEAIADSEITPLLNYVNAGGFLLMGSSSFTRNQAGTTRGNFAIASQMQINSLNGWTRNNYLVKNPAYANHRLVSHLPAGSLIWQMPSQSDEIPWGVYNCNQNHALADFADMWQVNRPGSSTATILADDGNGHPYLVATAYGSGYFIYNAALQPLIGHSGFAPGMYAYLFMRRAIEWAFEKAKTPIPKLSPWRYQHDSAFIVRHDLENFPGEIHDLKLSAKYEHDRGVKGDYYFCTGTLKHDVPDLYPSYNQSQMITDIQYAIQNYGATVGPHNGGLQNPFNLSSPSCSLLTQDKYEYWHWGPDEALDLSPPGYSSGKEYAKSSLSIAFSDIETWFSGLNNGSGLRPWVACYFNATREDSYDIQNQLSVKITGEQKISPFPHWTVSTRTADKLYPVLSEPASDWYVDGIVAQSLEPWHGVQTSETMHQGVDFYYNLGALINFYSHTLSDPTASGPYLGDPPPAGDLVADYINYCINTDLHPNLWSANAVDLYQWWVQRANAQISASYITNGNQCIATITITGAADPDTSVEELLPAHAANLQVYANGILNAAPYRINGQRIKIKVGTSVSSVQLRYALTPLAIADSYTVFSGQTLTVSAPGVLANDTPGSGASLSAVLVAGPAHAVSGSFSLNANGSFTYAPVNGFTSDSFTYQVNDGTSVSAPVTVSITIVPTFTDNFTRPTDPIGLEAPWVVHSSDTWTVTGGLLYGPDRLSGANPDYRLAYVANPWIDYSVKAKVTFPTGSYGGGIAGRVNTSTGARYAAWIYPDTSPVTPPVNEPNRVQLVKFDDWGTFTKVGPAYTPSPVVGTSPHNLELRFSGNSISIYYDNAIVIGPIPDTSYTSGGMDLEYWNIGSVSFDDVSVTP